MKFYTDQDVIMDLRQAIGKSSYRSVAQTLGLDVAYVHRIAFGKRPLTEEVAAHFGYAPTERKWLRAATRKGD